MNHRLESKHTDDQEGIENIKTRFDVLKKQLQDIHEEWGKINHGPPDKYHRLRQDELAHRESEVLVALRQLLSSADEVLGRTLERSRLGRTNSNC
jgi:hypothetical protein